MRARVSLLTIWMIVFLCTTTAFAAGLLVKAGMRGDSVRQVQQLLTDQGYSLGAIDGVCGGVTVDAIKKFQTQNGLAADGIVGAETYGCLTRNLPGASRHNGRRELWVTASGYSAYDPGNSHYTTTGTLLKKGIIAVDPELIPLGTRLYIPGYGEAFAGDVGSGIRGNKIDIAFDTREEALNFGRQTIAIYIAE